MAQINCDYGSVRFPIKELLEEIYAKVGETLNHSWGSGHGQPHLEVNIRVELDKIEEIRKLALEQAKACAGKQKGNKLEKQGLKSEVRYQSDESYYMLHNNFDNDTIRQNFFCIKYKHDEFRLYLRYSGMNKIDPLTRAIASQIDIKYDLKSHDLTLSLYFGFIYEDHKWHSEEKNTSELFELLSMVYDPEGKGYRFVTPFLVDKALEFPKDEMDGLTSKLIPESFQPPSLSLMSAKKLGDKKRQEHSDEVDMAYYQDKRRRLVQTTSDGYLFTRIQ
tara:strand:+ start:352 stop:1182 length:831 start_codon:yes stop_codon:yes gene_type:complete